MASGVMHDAFSPGEDRGKGDYEEMMPEHLLHEGLKYLASYVRSRKMPGMVLTVHANGAATIWGEDAFNNISQIMQSLVTIEERSKPVYWGEEQSG